MPAPVPSSGPVLALADLADRVLREPPRLGTTRLVCVDGPSGSGKSVLAARIARSLRSAGATVTELHMDDLYPGWDGLAAAVPLLVEQVLAPLAAGRPGRYRRFDWPAGAYAEEHDVPAGGVLLVEGVASGARAAARWAGLLLWVEAPLEERFRRGIERDGRAYLPHWQRWAVQEEEHFAVEGTRGRADLRVDGDPRGTPHDAERDVVLLTAQ